MRRSGCGLLLDVNNIVVCAANHGFRSLDYLHAFPLHAVAQIHLAAHAIQADSAGRELRIDSHDGPVQPDTWSLYEATLGITGPLPTLIEWDSRLPDWPELCRRSRAGPALPATFRGSAHAVRSHLRASPVR